MFSFLNSLTKSSCTVSNFSVALAIRICASRDCFRVPCKASIPVVSLLLFQSSTLAVGDLAVVLAVVIEAVRQRKAKN